MPDQAPTLKQLAVQKIDDVAWPCRRLFIIMPPVELGTHQVENGVACVTYLVFRWLHRCNSCYGLALEVLQ